MTTNKKTETIERFSLGSRVGHWCYVLFFIILLITGAALVFRGFGSLLGISGLKTATQIHRTIALPFTFIPIIILLVFSGKNIKRWLAEIFRFRKDDILFVTSFPKEFFGLKTSYPPQGRYNGGEKINSIIQLLGFFVMIITGWIMMFPASFSTGLVGWSRTIHGFCALALGAVMFGHAYLALLHPGSRESIKGMISGRVSMKFAKSHHPLWVEEVENRDLVIGKRGVPFHD